MWKNTVSRPTNRKHIFTLDDEGEIVAQVKTRTGRAVKCSMTEAGRVAIPSECYYGSIRLPDGSSRVMKLASDKTASVSMLAKMQAEEDKIASGQKVRKSETDETLMELVERFHQERVIGGIAYRQQVAVRRFMSMATKALGLKTIADVRGLTSGKISAWILGLDFAPHTKRHLASGLRSFLRWMHDQKLTPEVPRFPRIQGEVLTKRRALTRAEVDKLAAAAPWPRNLLYNLAFATIARRGALLALTAADIGFARTGAWLALLAENSKTGVGQKVPVPSRLVKDLKKLVKENPTGPLFPGVKVQLDGMDAFATDLKAAGIPKATPEGHAVFHCLRHSGTTAMVKAGVSLEIIRKMGGWKSLEMLARHYAHMEPVDARPIIDKVFE